MNEQPRTPPVAAGDRVRVTGILDDPAPLTVGMEGTVNWVGTWTTELTRQIGVQWDDGRCLLLLPGDPFRVIARSDRAPRPTHHRLSH
ncbi:Domain of unknown function DUF4314 [Mycobacteriaceae bacterium]